MSNRKVRGIMGRRGDRSMVLYLIEHMDIVYLIGMILKIVDCQVALLPQVSPSQYIRDTKSTAF